MKGILKMDYLEQIKNESIREFDEIYNRMPFAWSKWENPKRQTQKDLVSICSDMGKGFFTDQD
jgi:hypothetical protein